MSNFIDRLKDQLNSPTGVVKDISQIADQVINRRRPDTLPTGHSLDTQAAGRVTLPAGYTLSQEAAAAFDALQNNLPLVFLTGRAGTGKSTFIEYLKAKLGRNSITLAPTGIAALNIGGQTVHSFFKFPPRLFNNDEIKERHDTLIEQLQLIVLDEVSMIRADLLDHMDFALRKWRKRNEPFGGVQMLLVGDLLQLPPVVAGTTERALFEQQYSSPWFFSAEVFRELPVFAVELTEVHRQTDANFVHILNQIRTNKNHREGVARINRTCYRDRSARESALTLTATNRQADTLNLHRLDNINSVPRTYLGTTQGRFSREEQRLPAPMELTLKLGAQIMVTKNIDGAVNGTLGTVVSMSEHTIQIQALDGESQFTVGKELWEQYAYEWDPLYQRIVAKVIGTYQQLPVTLGWAVTIHKCQGLTMTSATIDLGRGAFAPGQTYVALSRCRSLDAITLARPISMKDVAADTDVLQFYAALFDC